MLILSFSHFLSLTIQGMIHQNPKVVYIMRLVYNAVPFNPVLKMFLQQEYPVRSGKIMGFLFKRKRVTEHWNTIDLVSHLAPGPSGPRPWEYS